MMLLCILIADNACTKWYLFMFSDFISISKQAQSKNIMQMNDITFQEWYGTHNIVRFNFTCNNKPCNQNASPAFELWWSKVLSSSLKYVISMHLSFTFLILHLKENIYNLRRSFMWRFWQVNSKFNRWLLHVKG